MDDDEKLQYIQNYIDRSIEFLVSRRNDEIHGGGQNGYANGYLAALYNVRNRMEELKQLKPEETPSETPSEKLIQDRFSNIF